MSAGTEMPGLAKAKPCPCYGCEMRGQGTCAAFTCSECGFESLQPLETSDVKASGAPYRPCGECRVQRAAA